MALGDAGGDHREEVEGCGLDGQGVGVDRGDVGVAVGVGAADRPGGLHLLHALIRPIMAGAVVGSSAGAPVTLWPLLTVSRLVPSWLISLSRPAWDEDERPRTATMAATPMAIPRADSPARSFRVRSPTVESRVRSESGSRLRLRVAVAVMTAPDRRERRSRLRCVDGGLSRKGEGGGGSRCRRRVRCRRRCGRRGSRPCGACARRWCGRG